MRITLKLFAIYQEVYQTDQLLLDLPEPTTASQLLDRCIQDHPQLAPWRNLTKIGVNLEMVSLDTPLQDGDEVVLIPPVSGG
jgi:sulfur-carrier protein